jgi:hypothetical protein
MRPEDAGVAAIPIRISLEQFIDAASGKTYYDFMTDKVSMLNQPDTFNVCKNNSLPERKVDGAFRDPLGKVLLKTPVPGLATGLGELPRFRSELGVFIGVVSAIKANTVGGGFGEGQETAGAVGGLDITVRLGLGIEGVLNEAGDGLVFLEAGWRQDGSSTMKYGASPQLLEGGQLTSAIPGRDAYSLRLRMPFYLIPFDLLLTAPILVWAAPETFASMAVTAGNGGLIPWQLGIATPVGRFQFILGREVGVALYGLSEDNTILVPESGVTKLVNLKSIQIEAPIVEYRPFRTFSLDQSSSLVFQLTVGADIPYSESLIVPVNSTKPKLGTVWHIGLRTAFDWRYYF